MPKLRTLRVTRGKALTLLYDKLYAGMTLEVDNMENAVRTLIELYRDGYFFARRKPIVPWKEMTDEQLTKELNTVNGYLEEPTPVTYVVGKAS